MERVDNRGGGSTTAYPPHLPPPPPPPPAPPSDVTAVKLWVIFSGIRSPGISNFVDMLYVCIASRLVYLNYSTKTVTNKSKTIATADEMK